MLNITLYVYAFYRHVYGKFNGWENISTVTLNDEIVVFKAKHPRTNTSPCLIRHQLKHTFKVRFKNGKTTVPARSFNSKVAAFEPLWVKKFGIKYDEGTWEAAENAENFLTQSTSPELRPEMAVNCPKVDFSKTSQKILQFDRFELERSKGGVCISSLQEEVERNSRGITNLKAARLQVGDQFSCAIYLSYTLLEHELIAPVDLIRPVEGISVEQLASTSEGIFFRCTIHALHQGLLRAIVLFRFHGFVIGRFIDAVVEDPRTTSDVLHLQPETPYAKVKPRKKAIYKDIVRGVPPTGQDFAKLFKRKLAPFPIPQELRQLALDGKYNKANTIAANPVTHASAFQKLLHLEEAKMDVDIRHYDRTSTMTFDRQLYWLNVPGLSEKRPSILHGDAVYVAVESDGASGKEYEGFVYDVHEESVGLKFNREFSERVWFDGACFDIRFTFNRTPLRRMHQAMVLSSTLPRQIIYPTEEHVKNIPIRSESIGSQTWDLNEEQRQAVRDIFNNNQGNVPYCIFGPPGTGKTTTIVEALLAIKALPGRRILVCGPSNSSADLITDRICNSFSVFEMLRLNAVQRSSIGMSNNVRKHSLCSEDGRSWRVPDLAEILKYRVVVSTYLSAGMLYALGVPPGHFTDFFFDEAGHAMEPELFVGLSGLVNGSSRIAIAGDPKQLGPVIRSTAARLNGLEKSFLQRVLELPVYGKSPPASALTVGSNRNENSPITRSDVPYNNPHIIIKLVRNYRSHPAVLDFSSKLFYDEDLIPSANKAYRESLTRWERLSPPNDKNPDGFPILFHGCQGKDMRENNSPSWFNPDEASLVKKFVVELTEARGLGIRHENIGVITPYRKQAEKIRKLFPKHNMMKIGSVEEFQGQERRVIIVSTVRSSDKFIDHDLHHNLGFLKNPRRLNVSITRAQCLLIVIGNPRVLRTDPTWRKFIDYVSKNGGYQGWDAPAEKASVSGLSETSQVHPEGKNETVKDTELSGQPQTVDDGAVPGSIDDLAEGVGRLNVNELFEMVDLATEVSDSEVEDKSWDLLEM